MSDQLFMPAIRIDYKLKATLAERQANLENESLGARLSRQIGARIFLALGGTNDVHDDLKPMALELATLHKQFSDVAAMMEDKDKLQQHYGVFDREFDRILQKYAQ